MTALRFTAVALLSEKDDIARLAKKSRNVPATSNPNHPPPVDIESALPKPGAIRNPHRYSCYDEGTI